MKVSQLLSFVLMTVAGVGAAQGPWAGIARGYRNWSRVDMSPAAASMVCPFSSNEVPPAPLHESRASHGSHEGKAFFLWVNNRDGYRRTLEEGTPPPAGLIVVKEGYKPIDLGPATPSALSMRRAMPTPRSDQRANVYTARNHQGRMLGVGEPIGLFVMRYTGTRWQFATINFDGRVESSGAMPQCANCHASAPHHGLFGLP